MNTKRQSLTLSSAEWAQLEALSVKHNAIATRGPSIGKPSWRALVRLIAQGQLTIAERRPAIAVDHGGDEPEVKQSNQSQQANTQAG